MGFSQQRVTPLYRRRALSAHEVYWLIEEALAQDRPLALTRVGDVMACLLSGRAQFIPAHAWRFLGLPYPLPERVLAELWQAIAQSDIVGLTHFEPFAAWMAAALAQKSVRPPAIADAFVNDALYEGGFINRLLADHPVALVGRSAGPAADRLAAAGCRVEAAVDLDGYAALPKTAAQLRHGRWRLALVGAGVPGRLLCPRLARLDGRVAIEIGHVLDGLAHPEVWRRTDRRDVFQKMYRAANSP